MSETGVRSFFRIVPAETAVIEDFQSGLQTCRRPRPVELADPIEWAGVLVFDTRGAAEFTARRFPQLGSYIAELRVPGVSPTIIRVIVLRTRGPGHHLLLGCAELLLPLIVEVRPVSK